LKTVLYGAFQQLKRSPFMTAILVLQILICTLIFTRITGMMQNDGKLVSVMNASFREENLVAWTVDYDAHPGGPCGPYNADLEQKAAAALDFDGAEAIIPVAKSMPRTFYFQSGLARANCVFYPDILADSIEIPLDKGEFWQRGRAYGMDDEIPAVVSPRMQQDFPLGSVQMLTMDQKSLSSLAPSLAQEEGLTLRVKIVGVLSQRNIYWQFYDIGRPLDDWLTSERDVMIMPDVDFGEGVDLGVYESRSVIVRFKGGQQEKMQDFIDAVFERDEGGAETVKSLREKGNATFDAYLRSDLVMFVIMFIVALTGIGGNNALIRQYNDKQYGVYFMSGSTWGRCVLMDILRNLMIIIPPGTLGIMYQFMVYSSDPVQPFLLDGRTIAAVVLMLVSIYVISSLSFILRTRRQKPVDIIRRWE
jgi:hypothetical protein